MVPGPLIGGTQIFGMSDFNIESGVATPFVTTTWVTIFSKVNTTRLTKIKALTIDNTVAVPSNPAFRIRACPTGGTKRVVFPFDTGESNIYPDDAEITFTEVIQIPLGYDYDVQVYCTVTGGASATLTQLKIIEYGW